MLYGNRVFLYFFFGKVFLGGQQFREAYDVFSGIRIS